MAIPNIAGTAVGSQTSTRSGKDGYVMEPKALLAALGAAEDEGGGLRAIVPTLMVIPLVFMRRKAGNHTFIPHRWQGSVQGAWHFSYRANDDIYSGVTPAI